MQNIISEEFRVTIENKNNRKIIRTLDKECKEIVPEVAVTASNFKIEHKPEENEMNTEKVQE